MQKNKKIFVNNQKHEVAWNVIFEFVKKEFTNLEETITFDSIQRYFCIGICLMVVCEIYNVTAIVKSLLSAIVPSARILCSTLTILQREWSSLLEEQVESTALFA